mgnify:FL=1
MTDKVDILEALKLLKKEERDIIVSQTLRDVFDGRASRPEHNLSENDRGVLEARITWQANKNRGGTGRLGELGLLELFGKTGLFLSANSKWTR